MFIEISHQETSRINIEPEIMFSVVRRYPCTGQAELIITHGDLQQEELKRSLQIPKEMPIFINWEVSVRGNQSRINGETKFLVEWSESMVSLYRIPDEKWEEYLQ